MATILVTGGAGFIGANFIHYWLSHRQGRIVNLDKLTYAGNPENLAAFRADDRHDLVRGDIGDRRLVGDLLRARHPVAVINFAAESHVDRSITGPAAFVETNLVGTFALLDEVKAYWSSLEGEARAAFRFLHVSTDEVYGSLGADAPGFSEVTPYAPNSHSSASKAGSDQLVRAYHHTYGLPVLTTNCSNNYGPFQFPEKLIPLIIHNALAGRPLPIYGDGLNVRDWLFVADHCSAIMRVLDAGRPGETYNVGGNSERQNIAVVHTLCDILDQLAPTERGVSYKDLITFVRDRPGHDRRYAIDPTKIRTELAWEPTHSFEAGMRETVRWYLDHQDWVQRVTSGAYREWVTAQYGE